MTKRDKKNTFLVFSPPKFGSACRIEATFLPVRFANAGSIFALKLPTTKTNDPVAQQEMVMRSTIHDTACELLMEIMGRRRKNAPKTEPSLGSRQ